MSFLDSVGELFDTAKDAGSLVITAAAQKKANEILGKPIAVTSSQVPSATPERQPDQRIIPADTPDAQQARAQQAQAMQSALAGAGDTLKWVLGAAALLAVVRLMGVRR